MPTAQLQKKLQQRIKVSREEEPGNLVLKNGQVVNVFTSEIITADSGRTGLGMVQMKICCWRLKL